MAVDTHKAVKKLKKVGFDEAQAEAVVRMVGEAFDDSVATKVDIAELRIEIQEVRGEIREVRTELRAEIRDLDQRMTIKLGGLLVLALTLLTAINKWIG